MNVNTQVSSPLEVILERMRKWDGSPWGRLQILSHQWLTRLENHPTFSFFPVRLFEFHMIPDTDTGVAADQTIHAYDVEALVFVMLRDRNGSS